jgi:hypothetical protein
MTKRIRYSFNRVCIWAVIAITAISAAMLVDFSPASSRQNALAAKQALSGLSAAVKRPAGVAGSPANQLVTSYGKLPLSFEVNQGQTNSSVKFLSRGSGYTLFLTGNEAVLGLRKAEAGSHKSGARRAAFGRRYSTFESRNSRFAQDLPGRLLASLESAISGPDSLIPSPQSLAPDPGPSTESATALRMRLVGANPHAVATGAEELPGKVNYFIGNDRKKWRTNVPTYAKVKYQGVYPGIDLVYYGNQGGRLEYDFVVAPGADPSAIALDVAAVSDRRTAVGTPPLQIADDGDLIIPTGDGEVRFHKPVAYQEAPSETGNSKFETRHTLARHSSLVTRHSIDGRFTLDAENRVRFALGPYDRSEPLVIDPVLVYSTYLGGSVSDSGSAIAVDSSGNAYVAGETSSSNFPTANPLQAQLRGVGVSNAFATKLNAAGSALVYSTYLGGSGGDAGYGIAVDSSGNAYVAGYTDSSDFPTANPLQAHLRGTCSNCRNAFVTKLNPAGSALVYSTYLETRPETRFLAVS